MSDSIDSRFREFHAENPHVYEELVRLARVWVARHGRKRLGIRTLWETMRWNLLIQTNDPSGFKLNDHYHSRYARLIMQREDDLADVFETRRLREGEPDYVATTEPPAPEWSPHAPKAPPAPTEGALF